MKASDKLIQKQIDQILEIVDDAAIMGRVSYSTVRQLERILLLQTRFNPFYKKVILITLAVVIVNIILLLTTSYRIGTTDYTIHQYKALLSQMTGDERYFWENKAEVIYLGFIPGWISYFFYGFYVVGSLYVLTENRPYRLIDDEIEY